MAARPAILCKPATFSTAIVCSHVPRFNSLKIVPVLEFPSPKFLFSQESVSQKPVLRYKRACSPNTMTDSISNSAMGSRTGDEEVTSFEQESFLNGSSEFSQKLTLVGFESALNLLSKWLVTALFGAVLLWRHDPEALWAAMGSVVNAGLSTILKQVLNQERPFSNLRSDPGMPSSHAQSIFFAVIFVVILMVQWLGVNGLSLTLSGLSLALGSYLSWLRVSQRLHTISQVVVGAVLGSIFTVLWFWSWEAIVLKAFVSYLWVRIIVLLMGGGFCVGFLMYIIRHWITKEK